MKSRCYGDTSFFHISALKLLGFFIVSTSSCTFARNRTSVFVRAAILTETSTGREIPLSLHLLSPFQKLTYIHLEICKGVGRGVSLSFTPSF